jgi:hypothetical protein
MQWLFILRALAMTGNRFEEFLLGFRAKTFDVSDLACLRRSF